VDEQSDYKKLKQATEAVARIQREIGFAKDPTPNAPTPDPILEPPPVQMGDGAVAPNSSHVSAAALHLMDEWERLRVENLGLQSRIRDLRAQVRRHEDWHIFERCGQRWSEGEDDGDGRMISVFGPDDGFAAYATNDRELWGVIEVLNGSKEGDESIDETARRVCNPEIHAKIRDGVRSLMLRDLLDGLKERGFPDPAFKDGGSVADAILRSIDERINDINKAAQEVADDEHLAARAERDGLLVQLAEARSSGVSASESEAVLRANELEAECDRLRDQVADAVKRASRLQNQTGWIRNQVIKAILAMDSGASPLDACQRARPILNAACAETPADPDGQCEPREVERLRRHVAELADELKIRDKTLGQLADIAEERDHLLVRVETLEQQIQNRRNPMRSDAPPGTWRGEESPPYDVLVRKYDVLVQKVASLEAGMAGVPMDAEYLDRIGRRFEAHASRIDDALRRIARLEALLCGEEGSGAEMLEEMIHSDEDRPSYRQVIAEAAEVKDQFGVLVGIVELDGRVIRDHSERLRKIEEGFGGHVERIKKLLEQSTPKSWWRR
jgi:hypothetical protein